MKQEAQAPAVATSSEAEMPTASSLTDHQPCDDCSGLVGLTSRKLGITCQELFRRAYEGSGEGNVRSRLAFVTFVHTGRESVPPLVQAYCAAQPPLALTDRPRASCVACTLSSAAWQTLVRCYAFAFSA